MACILLLKRGFEGRTYTRQISVFRILAWKTASNDSYAQE